jgi:hypothetical protein
MAPRLHMRDKCEIGTIITVQNGPEPTQEWNYGASTRCRFLRTSTTEIVDGKRRHETSTEIHLPATSSVTDAARIKLTRRNTASLADYEYYDVTGDPWHTQDNKVVVCRCTGVPAGSE